MSQTLGLSPAGSSTSPVDTANTGSRSNAATLGHQEATDDGWEDSDGEVEDDLEDISPPARLESMEDSPIGCQHPPSYESLLHKPNVSTIPESEAIPETQAMPEDGSLTYYMSPAPYPPQPINLEEDSPSRTPRPISGNFLPIPLPKKKAAARLKSRVRRVLMPVRVMQNFNVPLQRRSTVRSVNRRSTVRSINRPPPPKKSLFPLALPLNLKSGFTKPNPHATHIHIPARMDSLDDSESPPPAVEVPQQNITNTFLQTDPFPVAGPEKSTIDRTITVGTVMTLDKGSMGRVVTWAERGDLKVRNVSMTAGIDSDEESWVDMEEGESVTPDSGTSLSSSVLAEPPTPEVGLDVIPEDDYLPSISAIKRPLAARLQSRVRRTRSKVRRVLLMNVAAQAFGKKGGRREVETTHGHSSDSVRVESFHRPSTTNEEGYISPLQSPYHSTPSRSTSRLAQEVLVNYSSPSLARNKGIDALRTQWAGPMSPYAAPPLSPRSDSLEPSTNPLPPPTFSTNDRPVLVAMPQPTPSPLETHVMPLVNEAVEPTQHIPVVTSSSSMAPTPFLAPEQPMPSTAPSPIAPEQPSPLPSTSPASIPPTPANAPHNIAPISTVPTPSTTNTSANPSNDLSREASIARIAALLEPSPSAFSTGSEVHLARNLSMIAAKSIPSVDAVSDQVKDAGDGERKRSAGISVLEGAFCRMRPALSPASPADESPSSTTVPSSSVAGEAGSSPREQEGSPDDENRANMTLRSVLSETGTLVEADEVDRSPSTPSTATSGAMSPADTLIETISTVPCSAEDENVRLTQSIVSIDADANSLQSPTFVEPAPSTPEILNNPLASVEISVDTSTTAIGSPPALPNPIPVTPSGSIPAPITTNVEDLLSRISAAVARNKASLVTSPLSASTVSLPAVSSLVTSPISSPTVSPSPTTSPSAFSPPLNHPPSRSVPAPATGKPVSYRVTRSYTSPGIELLQPAVTSSPTTAPPITSPSPASLTSLNPQTAMPRSSSRQLDLNLPPVSKYIPQEPNWTPYTPRGGMVGSPVPVVSFGGQPSSVRTSTSSESSFKVLNVQRGVAEGEKGKKGGWFGTLGRKK
ncbi:hypothetical protein HK097_010427 [Rhizophlyctis rosea]|uniref:Uncharacterized protein n=1 Tax=Rhizophlyctis rosea TaxID=64517 RepID=A0AAD5X0H1_9FUNG|nr:hypothetical protein HK097_010427 [Rhizophlyctis rosea]